MKMRKKRAVLAGLAAVCLIGMTGSLAAGCGTKDAVSEKTGQEHLTGESKDSVVVTMPKTSEPEAGFDPAYGWGVGEHTHEPLIQSTLTTTTKDLQIGKDLAVDYKVSEDGLTWTVTIRDDVTFTDGEKLTAEDVAFTYNHCRDESTVADFTMLKEARALDETTVEFSMTKPYSIWPYTMAVVGIMPKHAYDEITGRIRSAREDIS